MPSVKPILVSPAAKAILARNGIAAEYIVEQYEGARNEPKRWARIPVGTEEVTVVEMPADWRVIE